MHATVLNFQKAQRIKRVRAKISGTAERPRLAVSRSLAHIQAQIIDDVSGRTLVAVNDLELAKEITGKKKVEVAHLLGKTLGAHALEKGIKSVVFDRRDKQYHGRVRAVAEGAREAGLIF